MKEPGIRILNIFYIYCYAWRLLREGRSVVVGASDSPNAVEFLARVLLNGTRLLLRRGLEQGYAEVEDEVPGLRGRILLGVSYRRFLLGQGKAICRYDEMGHDTANNKIMKATLAALATTIELRRETRNAIIEVLSRVSDVSAIKLSPSVFSQVTLHQNNSYYELVLKLCHLIYLGLLPIQTGQSMRFVDPMDDETRMSSVFEEFIRVFYQTEITGFTSANREDIRWITPELDDFHARYLPKMQTDITLRSPDRTLIIDAKYYKDVFTNFRGAEKVRSANLYQMFSYVKNCSSASSEPRPEGLLIYPSSDKNLTLDYRLDNHRISVGTVDLNQEWREINSRLRELVSANGGGVILPIRLAGDVGGTGKSSPSAPPSLAFPRAAPYQDSDPWIPERSATRLREADLNILSKLGKQGLEWRLEPEAFTGREVRREDDLLDFPVGCPVDVEVARQPSA